MSERITRSRRPTEIWELGELGLRQAGLVGRRKDQVLLETLHQRLALEGATEIYLRVYDWNVAARRLYARTGYEVVRQFVTDAHLRRRLNVHAANQN